MTRSIPAFPTPRLTELLSSRRFDLTRSFSALYSTGSAALYWFFRSLRPGMTVWMPSFHCGTEVQAAVDANLRVDFYRLRENLAPDEEDLGRRLRTAPGAVLLIHYYGLVQDHIATIDAMCREHSAILIEDCAHAMFSPDAGNWGAAACYSFPKALPVLEGGALRLDSARLERGGWERSRWDHSLRGSAIGLRKYAKQALRNLTPQSVIRLYRQAKLARALPPDSRVSPAPLTYDSQLSEISRRLIAVTDTEEVVARRRNNWNTLHSLLSAQASYHPVFDTFPSGSCPLSLPIFVGEREALVAKLDQKGIGSWVFGSLPHPRLSGELRDELTALRDNTLCIPVHQQLDDHDMDRIAKVLSVELSNHRFAGHHSRSPFD